MQDAQGKQINEGDVCMVIGSSAGFSCGFELGALLIAGRDRCSWTGYYPRYGRGGILRTDWTQIGRYVIRIGKL